MFRISEGFGLGMGMMEMCGALSGMTMIIGLENSVGDPEKGAPTKTQTYKAVQKYINKFKENNGSYICRELKGVETKKVQSNFGATEDLVVDGKALGREILKKCQREETGKEGKTAFSEQDKGSIMSILATDLPVTARQLKRIIRRLGAGIARTGAYMGHGSGEVMIGFTTANRVPSVKLRREKEELRMLAAIPEETINRAFLAAAEAEEEAVLNSMVTAAETQGLQGERYRSLAEFLGE